MSRLFLEQKVCVFFQVAKSENKSDSTKRIKGHQVYQVFHPSEKENFCFEVLCQFDEDLCCFGASHISRKRIITSLPFGPYRLIFRTNKGVNHIEQLMALNDFLTAQKIDEHNPSSVCW